MSIWTTAILEPLINLLMFTYQALGGNLGIAIIAVTIMVRMALLPLTNPGMQSAQKMQELKPELDKLKKKHKDDKQALAQAQLELYKKHGINPLGGILPMILQFVVLIGLFQAFNLILKPDLTVPDLNQYLYTFLKVGDGFQFNSDFFFWNLTRPDTINLTDPISILGFSLPGIPGILLISAAVIQFVSTKYMMPKPTVPAKNAQSDEPDIATMMQKQMLVMMPLMTLVIGLTFPAGLVLYWLTFSIIMVVQQKIIKSQPAKVTTTKK